MAVWAVSYPVLDVQTPDAFVQVADDASLDLVNAFTLEAWVNFSSIVPTGEQIALSKPRSLNGTGYKIGLSNGQPLLGFNDGVGVNLAVISPSPLSAGSWHHIAGTYDGSNAKVYVDGILKKTTAISFSLLNSSEPLFIGKEGLPIQQGHFRGLIDEVRIWGRALSETEIQDQMNSILAGTESDLRGYWNFNGGDASDLSPFSNHGTIQGNAFVTSVPEAGSSWILIAFSAGSLFLAGMRL